MPRFYFDVIDTGELTTDHEGVELSDLAEAREEALRTLGAIVRDELPDGDRREFAIHVRDGGGAVPVLTATISLRVDRKS